MSPHTRPPFTQSIHPRGEGNPTPGVSVFAASGESLENYGVQPDVWVDNTPEDFLAGHDRQIEEAIEMLRAEMK